MLQHFTRLSLSDALPRSPQSGNNIRSIPSTPLQSGPRDWQQLSSAGRYLGPSRSSLKATFATDTLLRLDESSPESWASAASRLLPPIAEGEDQAPGDGAGLAGTGSGGHTPCSMASEDLNQLLQDLEAEEDFPLRPGRRRSLSQSAEGEGPEPSFYTAPPEATTSLWSNGPASGRRHRSGLPDDFPVRQLHFGLEATSPLARGTHPASSPLHITAPTFPTGGVGPLQQPSSLQRWCEPCVGVGDSTPSYTHPGTGEPTVSLNPKMGALSPSNVHAWKGDPTASPYIQVLGSIPREGHFRECGPSSSPPSTGESARSASLIRLLHDLDLEDSGAGVSPSWRSEERHGFSRMSPILSGVTPTSHVSTPHTGGTAEDGQGEGRAPVSTPASRVGTPESRVSTPHTRVAAGSAPVEGGQAPGAASQGPLAFTRAGHWASPAGGGGALFREGSGLTFYASPTASLGGPSPVRGSIEWGSPSGPGRALVRDGSGLTVFASPTPSLPGPSPYSHTGSSDAEESPVLAWTTGRRAATRRVISDGEDDSPSGLRVCRPEPGPLGTGLFGEMGALSISPHQDGPDGVASSQYVISDSEPPTPTSRAVRGAAAASPRTPQGGVPVSWRDATSQGAGTSFWTGATSQGGAGASWTDATSQGRDMASWRGATSQGGGTASRRDATLQGGATAFGRGSPGSDSSGSFHIVAKSTRKLQYCLDSDSEHKSACGRDVTLQGVGTACGRGSPGSASSGSLHIVGKSTRRPQYCLASDSEHESPCGVSSKSPQARAPGARKEAFRVAANGESSSSTGRGGRKEAVRVAVKDESSSAAACRRGIDGSDGAANSENSSSRAPRARKDAFRVAGDNESSSSSSSSRGRQVGDQGRSPGAARDAYEFPADEGAGAVPPVDPVVRDLGFGGAGRKPLPQAGAVLEAPGIMDTLRAALPTFDRKGRGYDGDDDVIEISDSEDGESSEGVEDDDDDGLFILNDQENSLLYPPFPPTRPAGRRPPLTPLRDPVTPRPTNRRPPLTPFRDPMTPFYDPQTPRPTGRRPPLTPLRDPVTPHPGPHHMPGTAPKVAMTPATVAAFRRQREALAESLYKQFNARVFEGKLPENLKISWNPRLKTTAGLTYHSREAGANPGEPQRYSAHVELSSKVVDAPHKLEATLLHELCHVAAWLLDHTSKPPHGPAFKRWAQRAHAVFPQIPVTRCHHYSVHVPFEWRCQNPECGEVFKRHSRSINTARMRCGRCRSSLAFLGKFNVDGTPAKTRTASAFSLFVRDNFAAAKASAGAGTPHADVMQALGRQWRARKVTQEVAGTPRS